MLFDAVKRWSLDGVEIKLDGRVSRQGLRFSAGSPLATKPLRKAGAAVVRGCPTLEVQSQGWQELPGDLWTNPQMGWKVH